MIRSMLGILVLLVATCLATGQGEPADKKAVVKQVFEAWKERRAKCKSVRYKVSGVIIVPKGSMVSMEDDGRPKAGGALPKSDVSCPKKVTMLLDFATQRFRYEMAEKNYNTQTASFGDAVATWTYTGKEYWAATPRQVNGLSPENSDATVLTGNLRETAFTPEEWPLFISHGFVPTLMDPILPGRFQPKLEEKEFYYFGDAIHAKRNCTVLRTEVDHFLGKAFNEYWVDMGRGAVVSRMVVYVNGSPAWDLDMQYKETAAGWLVAGWATARRPPGGRTDRIYKMHVDACELDPATSKADFEVTLTPGMKVTRIHRGGNEESAAPAILSPGGTEQIFVVNENGKMRQVAGTPTPTNYTWWVVGGVGGVALLLAGGWYRGRRKAASQP